MRSMTGYGQASGETERLRATVTLKAVNHRFLDLSLRLRDDQRGLERDLRELLAAQLRRGRVEVHCEIEAVAERAVSLTVNGGLVRAVAGAVADLEDRGLLSGGLTFGDLVRLPEAVRLTVDELDWQEADRQHVLAVAGRALDQLVAARCSEGAKLRAALEQRIDGLAVCHGRMAERAEVLPAQLAAALGQRIDKLLDGALPEPDRLAQEVALLVDRGDVSEELDRLASHLDHCREILGQEGSIGKRLDFLAQEIFRELNTIGSKCRDSELTRQVLDSKVLCEQIREQIQNVE